jgi:hypothetical protein
VLAAAPSEALLGSTEPRLFTAPARPLTPETSLGFEACEFVENVIGDTLLPWQRWLFEHALEMDGNGRFRFRTVLVLVGRQSGKSTWAKYLALWRIFGDDAKLVLGTAQNLDVSEALWKQAVETAEDCLALRKQITQVEMSSGRKTLHVKGGKQYKVQSANRRGGRGMSGDLVLLDELREHQTWDAWSAVSKTTMARPRAQLVCLSNAGDDNSVVLNDLRERALQQLDDPHSQIGIFEWSAPDDCDVDDPANWAMATPSLGYTIEIESIRAAKTTDPEWVFRTEVLCQRVNLAAVSPLPRWPHVREPGSTAPVGAPTGFAVDVSWDRSRAWIGAAVRLPDGRTHLEAVASDEGTEWVLPRLRELCERWSPVAVGLQASGAPASTLLGELEEFLDVPVAAIGGADLARACGSMFDAVANGTVRHPGQEPIDSAARHASIRPLSDAWVFDRKRSPVDIAGLMAEAMALWVLSTIKPKPKRTAPRRIR